MNDVVGKIEQLTTAPPLAEPMSEIGTLVAQAMEQSFKHGFETGKTRAMRVIADNLGTTPYELLKLIENEAPPAI